MANERLINVDATIKQMFADDERTGTSIWETPEVADFLEYHCPTVEAVPVVRGEWENNEYGFQCNKCKGDSLYNGFNHPVKSNYCPNCGAKMDGGESK